MSIDDLLIQLSQNRIDPAANSMNSVPESTGLYLVLLKAGVTLPKLFNKVKFSEFNNSMLLYIGIAGSEKSKRNNLRKRINDHFEGNNAGKSTLRKSIGVIFGYKLIPRDKNPRTGKTKFSAKDEEQLSNWMKQSLFLYFSQHSTPWTVEDELIEKYNPPLNLSGNKNTINANFREIVSQLRNPIS